MLTHEGDARGHPHTQRRGSPAKRTTKRTSSYTSGGTSTTTPTYSSRSIGAWCSFRKYTLDLYDRPSAPLELKTRILKAEVLGTMLYGCVTWSPRASHYDMLRRAQHSFLTSCIGWQNPIFYLDTLMRTGSESIGAIMRRRRFLFAEFVARMKETGLPKCVMFGKLMGGAGCVEGQ